MINVKQLILPEVKLLMPQLHHDDRGYVTEIAHGRQLQEVGLPGEFVQENQSMSRFKNTVRGMHSQQPPFAQAKLVRVLRGRIFDVAVDVRQGSPTFGQHVSAILSDDEITQMFIPVGFLHGFCTLEDNTVVLYKMSSFYVPGSEIGVKWNDPELKIEWPVKTEDAILSDKDNKLGSLSAFPRLTW